MLTGAERPFENPVSYEHGFGRQNLVHWARGGTTDLPNQVLLCGFHHGQVHEGGWQIVKLDDGQIMTLRPPPTFPHWARGPDEARAA